MTQFRHIAVLLVAVLASTTTLLAQEEPASGGKYSKRNEAQQESFEKGEYLFPARPRDNYSIGITAGLAAVSGDVTMLPGWTAGLAFRKAMGHVFSLRATANFAQMRGLNYQANAGYYGHTFGNPWNAKYGSTWGVGSSGPGAKSYVYYNFKSNTFDAAIEGIVNLNNINFYKREIKWNLYAFGGAGLTGYTTKVNATDDNNGGAIYDFSPVYPLSNEINNLAVFGFGSQRSEIRTALKEMMDDSYESVAEQNKDGRGFNVGDNYYQINPMVIAGAGVRYKISNRIDVELQHRISGTTDDLLDGSRWTEWGGYGPNVGPTAMSRDNDNYSLTTLGIQFRLGGNAESAWFNNPLENVYKRVQDQQQTIARMDDDTDGDGIPDLFDKEADTPAGTSVDANGRALDSDGDGVTDANDAEPFSPKGSKVDGQGRALDSDGDGVPDLFDKQNQKPQPGQFVDARGYIVEIPKVEAAPAPKVEVPCLLPVIYFDLDKDNIKTDYYPELYYIAQAMKNDPSLRVKTSGHTDVRNSDEYNQNLSDRRVKNAVDFLVNTYGIDRSRFEIGAQGEKQNVVANLPANHSNPKLENMHMLNRRVEFHCIKK